MRSAALEPYHPTGERRHSPLAGGSSTRASTPTRTPAPSSRPSTSRPPTFRVRRPQHITRAQRASQHSPALRQAQLALNKQGAPAVARRRPAPPDPGAHAAHAPAESIEQYLEKGFSYARTGNPTVAAQADSCAPRPPYGTYGRRVPASRFVYVPEAQGSLPPGPHALATRPSLGRAACTVTRVPCGPAHPHLR